jgi:hypothetical protein
MEDDMYKCIDGILGNDCIITLMVDWMYKRWYYIIEIIMLNAIYIYIYLSV